MFAEGTIGLRRGEEGTDSERDETWRGNGDDGPVKGEDGGGDLCEAERVGL